MDIQMPNDGLYGLFGACWATKIGNIMVWWWFIITGEPWLIVVEKGRANNNCGKPNWSSQSWIQTEIASDLPSNMGVPLAFFLFWDRQTTFHKIGLRLRNLAHWEEATLYHASFYEHLNGSSGVSQFWSPGRWLLGGRLKAAASRFQGTPVYRDSSRVHSWW